MERKGTWRLFFFSESQSQWSHWGFLNQRSLKLEMKNHDLSHHTRSPCCDTSSTTRSGRPVNNSRLWGTCGAHELPSDVVLVGRPDSSLWTLQSSVSDFPLLLKPDAGCVCVVADSQKGFIFIAWALVSEPHQLQPFVLPTGVWSEMMTSSLPWNSSQIVRRWKPTFTMRTERVENLDSKLQRQIHSQHPNA